MRYLIFIFCLLFTVSSYANPVRWYNAVLASASDWFDGAQLDSLWAWDYPTAYGNGVTDIKFQSTGTEFWVLDNHDYDIHYTSTTEAWNPYKAEDTPGQSFDFTATCGTEPNAFAFNADNTELFVTDNAANSVCGYTMGAQNQIAGSIFFASTSFSGDIAELRDMAFVDSGNELHLLDHTPGKIFVYDLSTPYRPATKTLNSTKSEDFSDVRDDAFGFDYRLNGAEIVLVGDSVTLANTLVCELSTAYDPSTRTTCREVTRTESGNVYGVTVDDDLETYYLNRVWTTDTIEVYKATLTIPPIPPEGSGPDVDGVQVVMTNSGWIGVQDFAITVDGTTNDIIDDMTPNSGGIIDDFADLALNEYGTDSDYNPNDNRWDDAAWNDGDDPVGNSPHWSDSSSSGLDIFVKFSATTQVNKIRIFFAGIINYGYPTISFKDDLGNTLTPVTSPADENDTVYVSGTSRAYEWTF